MYCLYIHENVDIFVWPLKYIKSSLSDCKQMIAIDGEESYTILKVLNMGYHKVLFWDPFSLKYIYFLLENCLENMGVEYHIYCRYILPSVFNCVDGCIYQYCYHFIFKWRVFLLKYFNTFLFSKFCFCTLHLKIK